MIDDIGDVVDSITRRNLILREQSKIPGYEVPRVSKLNIRLRRQAY